VKFEEIPPENVPVANHEGWEMPEEIRGNLVRDAYSVSHLNLFITAISVWIADY
jgi:hypothetical protein